MQWYDRRSPFLVLVALVVGSVPARGQQSASNKQVINIPGRPPGVLSPAVRVGDLIFLSGVMGTKPGGGGLADSTIEGQTRQALENVKTGVALAGVTMADVAKCTVFLTDAYEFASMNKVYHEFFTTDPPARSTVVVAALVLPNAKIEIECIATAKR
jgi:2-iminobutanoate/2-iminopropanoate deaminase